MAIKISGTSVIDDSRQLQNITGLDNTTTDTIVDALNLGGEIYSNATIYTSSDTWAVPAGATKALVFVLAGGGGSGNQSATTVGDITTTHKPAGAGGPGGLAIKEYDVVAANTYTITIGAGGAGLAAGTPSKFTNTLVATAGQPGTSGTSTLVGSVGAAGIGTNADFNTNVVTFDAFAHKYSMIDAAAIAFNAIAGKSSSRDKADTVATTVANVYNQNTSFRPGSRGAARTNVGVIRLTSAAHGAVSGAVLILYK